MSERTKILCLGIVALIVAAGLVISKRKAQPEVILLPAAPVDLTQNPFADAQTPVADYWLRIWDIKTDQPAQGLPSPDQIYFTSKAKPVVKYDTTKKIYRITFTDSKPK